MFERIIGVFKLDSNTFEEIEHDANATGQAALVVALAAVFSGVGTLFRGDMSDFIKSFGWTIVGWFVWSCATYLVGTKLFNGVADLGEMMRVIGFAYAPQMLGIVPCIGSFIGAIWTFVAGFIAVRQGLDLDNTRAFFTIFVGFIVYIAGMITLFIFSGIFGLR